MPTELPSKCRFLYVWHQGTPEARSYWRTSPNHRTHSERFESGMTITTCEICGAVCGDV